MAKAVYIGINNLAQKVKAIYIGINGTARKVVKGYIGVNGAARLFWDGGGAKKGFWFYFKCKAEYCFTINGRKFSKKNVGIAFCYVTNRDNQNPRDHYWSEPRFASTDIDAIAYTTSIGGNFTTPLYSYQINGDTWYFNAPDYAMAGMYTPSPSEALLSTDTYVIPVYTPSQSNPRQDDMDMLDMIYSNDFAEEYQVGQRYNLVKGDVELTIRKFLAIYLFRYERWGRGNYDTAYNALCNHVEDIVAYFLQQIGGNDTIRIGGDYARSDTGLDIYVYYGTGTLNNILITDRIDDVDYSHCYGDGEWTSVGMADVEILNNGSLVYNNMAYTSQESVYIGKEGYGDDYMEWTNIGLDFHLAQLSFTFHENFIVGNKYNLTKASIELTIRMAIQIFLDKNSSHSSDAGYITLKNNVNTLVSYFMGFINSGYRTFDIGLVQIEYSSYYNAIDVTVFYSFTDMSNQIIESENQSEGYTYYTFNNDYDGEILDFSYIAWATLENPIDYGYNDDPSVDPLRIIGACLDVESGWDKVQLSNLGIDF